MRKLLCLGKAAVRAAMALSLIATCAGAHGIEGTRMFLEPLVTEDANVKNELVLPSGEFQVQSDGTWRALEFSFEKELYPHRLSWVLQGGRTYQHTGGGRIAGWDNLETGLKWEGLTSERHEFVLSPALFVTFPTGSASVSPHQTSLKPMLLYAKGFGDVRGKWLKPLALQGDVGLEASVRGPRDRQLVYDAVLMYSIPYVNERIRRANGGYSMEHDLRLGFSRGALFGNLFPFVEFNGTSAVRGAPGGTSTSLRPGWAWMGKYVQVSVAAALPLRTPDVVRPHTGAVVLVDWFLDELVPGFNWTPFGKSHHHED